VSDYWVAPVSSATIVAVILSLGGKFIPLLEPFSRVSWFVGVIVAFVCFIHEINFPG
jgi:cytosine/uracil/thiamine/allantoin permease